ncbi:hypothetical protein HDU79_005406 [Rhizoclosmatium sp. JEL0117]|nr:hypothetical protein HDU79_005406 [Rhizoclosmatium sp. JEL0117]
MIQPENQPSLGEFNWDDLAELSLGASATTEMVKKVAKETWLQFATPPKHIEVMYKGLCYTFEISKMSTSDLHSAIQQSFLLNAAVRSLFYLYSDGTKVWVTEIRDFEKGKTYYLRTVADEDDSVRKFTDIEGFYRALKEDEEMNESQVDQARQVFAEQDLGFKQLMLTGDLAITDAELSKKV